jgi:DNA mismatch endonuclease (patch repair protein)
MADVLTPQQRSLCMSRNRGRNTGPEILLRRELWRRGLRYRLAAKLPGKPDITFGRSKVAIFVDGCFWHGCPQHSVRPKTNAEFWRKKIAQNRLRDAQVTAMLRNSGWRVVRIWEHQIKTGLDTCVGEIESAIRA